MKTQNFTGISSITSAFLHPFSELIILTPVTNTVHLSHLTLRFRSTLAIHLRPDVITRTPLGNSLSFVNSRMNRAPRFIRYLMFFWNIRFCRSYPSADAWECLFLS